MKLTEKQKNCPYCRSKDPDANAEIYKNGDEYLAIGSDGDVEIDEGNLVMEENYYLYQEKLFKYCPMCGQPLGDDSKMKAGDRIYVLVSTWDCYSDYTEKVLYVTDGRQDAINESKTIQVEMNTKSIAESISDTWHETIDEDTKIVLRSYPFKQSINDLTEAERQAYEIDEDTLCTAKLADFEVDGQKFKCYLLKSEGSDANAENEKR